MVSRARTDELVEGWVPGSLGCSAGILGAQAAGTDGLLIIR